MNSQNQNTTLWGMIPGMPKSIADIQISGSFLKWIAIVTMFIDHFTVAVTGRILRFGNIPHKPEIYATYKLCRAIGRAGFPIFCFLLVEGLLHTKNRAKYALRLFLFCFISEFPFDIALFNSWYTLEHQNVFWTLLIGYLAIWALDEIWERFRQKPYLLLLGPVVLAAAYFLAEFMHTDYRGYGVLTIVFMYLFHANFTLSMAAGLFVLCGFNLSELPALFTLIPISFYNGTRGKQPKYFFYVFYPAHLMLLYLLAVVLRLV